MKVAKRAASRDPGGGSQPTRSAFHMCHFLLASAGGGWHDVVASGAPQTDTGGYALHKADIQTNLFFSVFFKQ